MATSKNSLPPHVFISPAEINIFLCLSSGIEDLWPIKSMWNTAVGIKNCRQLFSLRVAFTTQKKATRAAEMMSVERVAIFWVVNASSGEKSCLQFSIPTGSGGGGVSHSLKERIEIHYLSGKNYQRNFFELVDIFLEKCTSRISKNI